VKEYVDHRSEEQYTLVSSLYPIKLSQCLLYKPAVWVSEKGIDHCSEVSYCYFYYSIKASQCFFLPACYWVSVESYNITALDNQYAVGYSDFHNLMGFTSKKMPNNIL
jgi:hypothetical protein